MAHPVESQISASQGLCGPRQGLCGPRDGRPPADTASDTLGGVTVPSLVPALPSAKAANVVGGTAEAARLTGMPPMLRRNINSGLLTAPDG